MGCDKAGLIIHGQPLWQRQLATLRALEPQELFISGRPNGPYVGAGVPIVFDTEPNLGPMGGLVAALRRNQNPFLLVLAIDLPAMSTDFLRCLVQSASDQKLGVAPYFDGRFEPLAAVYPQACLPLVEEVLRVGVDRSLQGLIREAVARGIMRGYPLREVERSVFRNLNTPQDFGSLSEVLGT